MNYNFLRRKQKIKTRRNEHAIYYTAAEYAYSNLTTFVCYCIHEMNRRLRLGSLIFQIMRIITFDRFVEFDRWPNAHRPRDIVLGRLPACGIACNFSMETEN